MNTEEIKKIVTSQKEELEEKFEKTRIIKRVVDYKKLSLFLSAPNILAILGLRRCGKSILSLQIFEGENFGYVNFDDERLSGFKTRDFEKLLNAFYELYGDIDKIILDEPQNIPRWELFANRLRRTKKVIITGSNSKLLSGELATALTGRYISFTLFPFSFREYLTYNGFEFGKGDVYSTRKVSLVKKQLADFLKIGGIPEAYLFGREILVRIYADIIEKDVLGRLKPKKKSALKEMAKYLISNSASEFSFSKLKNLLKIKDQHTIKNWVSALEDAYLFFVLERYSPKLKEQIIAPKKVYCVDTGITNVMSFKLSQNFGRLMENVVAVELLRRKSYWHDNWEIYYWKDYQQREVDFIIKEGLNITKLVQVTYASARDEVNTREIKSLLKASDLLKCKDLLVITWDYEAVEEIKNKKIKFVPLWNWLLVSNKNSLRLNI